MWCKAMNINRYLFRINRISAWVLLVFMILFLISGYAWADNIIMPVQQARWLHTRLDTYLVIFFLLHALISIKFALKRWKLRRHEIIVNISLSLIGLAAFASVLGIKYLY